jgi:hypothetical protein
MGLFSSQVGFNGLNWVRDSDSDCGAVREMLLVKVLPKEARADPFLIVAGASIRTFGEVS